MSIHKEISFEVEICARLTAHGWLHSEGDAALYDRARALVSADVKLTRAADVKLAHLQDRSLTEEGAVLTGEEVTSRNPRSIVCVRSARPCGFSDT